MKYKVLKKQNNSDMCFVCGSENDAGTKASFYECQSENGESVLLTVAHPDIKHQSFPGRMHGGIISALLDEAIGRAVQIENPEIWAVTIDLKIKFRKPVPLDQTLYIESKITDLGTRAFDGEGKLFLNDGTVCATAAGKFFIVKLENAFKDNELNENNWYYIDEKIPESFSFDF